MWGKIAKAGVYLVFCTAFLAGMEVSFASDAREFAEKMYHGKLHYGFNKQGKVVLLKGEKEAHLGAFGSGYHSLFRGSEMAQKAASEAHTLAICSMVLTIVGMASTIAGTTIFVLDPNGFFPEHRPGKAALNVTLLFGGLVILYSAMILNIRAQEKTFFAIKAYNRDIEKQALKKWKERENQNMYPRRWMSKKGGQTGRKEGRQILGVY